MRTASVLACITIIAGTIGAGSAFAQSAPTLNSPDIVSGSFGSMTCSDFNALSHAQQVGATRQARDDAAPSSLTSNSGLGNISADAGGSSSNSADGGYTGALGLGAPLNSGQLIAACQAAPASATLQDAYSSFVSGGNNNGARTLR